MHWKDLNLKVRIVLFASSLADTYLIKDKRLPKKYELKSLNYVANLK